MDAIETSRSSPAGARERIALAAGGALLVAGLILVAAVLPAEYAVDPLGIGARLGLTPMGDLQKSLNALDATRAASPTSTGGAPTVAPQDRKYQQETVEFKLAPGGSIEYKYRLDKGESLLFSWTATARVNYELHAEPDGAPQGYAETFDKQNSRDGASGTLTAPFSGIHGWYWENTGDTDVVVTLSASGFFNMSHTFLAGADPITKIY